MPFSWVSYHLVAAAVDRVNFIVGVGHGAQPCWPPPPLKALPSLGFLEPRVTSPLQLTGPGRLESCVYLRVFVSFPGPSRPLSSFRLSEPPSFLSVPCIVPATPDSTSPTAFPPSSGSLLVMQMRRWPSAKWWAWLFVNPCHIIYRHRRLGARVGRQSLTRPALHPNTLVLQEISP